MEARNSAEFRYAGGSWPAELLGARPGGLPDISLTLLVPFSLTTDFAISDHIL